MTLKELLTILPYWTDVGVHLGNLDYIGEYPAKKLLNGKAGVPSQILNRKVTFVCANGNDKIGVFVSTKQ